MRAPDHSLWEDGDAQMPSARGGSVRGDPGEAVSWRVEAWDVMKLSASRLRLRGFRVAD